LADNWDPSRLYRYISHVERELNRELTDAEWRICLRTYYSSNEGFKKTRHRVRKALKTHQSHEDEAGSL